jgi:hypothetical protein
MKAKRHSLRYLTLVTILIVLGSGCNSERNRLAEKRNNSTTTNPNIVDLPVTAAYVSVEPLMAAQNMGKTASSPEWITEGARSAGLAVRYAMTWQELPDGDDYGLHVTQREIITCRALAPRQDDKAVVEIKAQVAHFSTTVTLNLKDAARQFIKVSERDGVALRLGWDDSPPPLIFGRALLLHKQSDGNKGFPNDIPGWMTTVIQRQGFTSCEDLGKGKWINIKANPVTLGSSPALGNVYASTVLREASGTVTVSASIVDENRNALKTAGSVQPVCPGNEHPGNLLSLTRWGRPEPYITVLLLYGQCPSSNSSPSEGKQDIIEKAQQKNSPDKK